jgi:hypothetical protein
VIASSFGAVTRPPLAHAITSLNPHVFHPARAIRSICFANRLGEIRVTPNSCRRSTL